MNFLQKIATLVRIQFISSDEPVQGVAAIRRRLLVEVGLALAHNTGSRRSGSSVAVLLEKLGRVGLLGHPAAINENVRACNEVCIFGTEETRQLPNIIHIAPPVSGPCHVTLPQFLQSFLRRTTFMRILIRLLIAFALVASVMACSRSSEETASTAPAQPAAQTPSTPAPVAEKSSEPAATTAGKDLAPKSTPV